VNEYVNQSFDFVITVCDNAKQSCPVFTGVVNERLHIGFEDPAEAIGAEEQILNEFRGVRDKIKRELHKFYTENIKNKST
ncbi:MAG: arsenate reductase ArsC, partial [Planctomycetia bacterium]|nr:arsenate reductase ArsC [Planctomycetia bacterium]